MISVCIDISKDKSTVCILRTKWKYYQKTFIVEHTKESLMN